MRHKFVFVVLLLVIVFGAFLRFFHLTTLPPSLNWDEVSHGYTALSLLQTGRDQWGQALPVFNFRAYGDYPAPLNLYFTVPSLALFGPTDFALRFPHTLAGILVIFIVFMAAYRWTGNKYAALLAAFFVSFDPWTFFPSRAVFQSNWVVLWLSLAAAFLPTKNYWLHICLAISLFAYHNTRIFVPLFAVWLIITQPKYRKLSLSLVLLSVLIIFSPTARTRNSSVSILDSGSIAQIEALRNSSQLPPPLSKLMYNRPLYFIYHVISNYFDYFSPAFLFQSGGTQYQFSVPHFGVLSLIQLPFFYLGLIILIFKTRYRSLLMWLILAPLPAALTRDQFAVIRATTMLPIVQIISSLSLALVFTKLSLLVKKSTVIIIIILALALQVNYFSYYYNSYNRTYSQSWQYGYAQLIDYLKVHGKDYDQIVITKRYGEPHEFLLWYWLWPPLQFQHDPNLVWDYHANWYWVDGFAKFRFVNDWELPQTSLNLSPHTLIISSPDNTPLVGGKVVSINFLDGSPAFIISQL